MGPPSAGTGDEPGQVGNQQAQRLRAAEPRYEERTEGTSWSWMPKRVR